MKRRDFLKAVGHGASLFGALGTLGLRSAIAAPLTQRTLVNVMLLGGADLRYLFVPAPGSAYADAFWAARQDIYNAQPATSYASYDLAFADLYLPVTAGGVNFGIHRNAAWLKAQFDLGNVAIVANMKGSVNRRHDHSQLIMHTGDPLTTAYGTDRDGWGGRLIEHIAGSRAVAVSRDVAPFVKGTDPSNREARVLHAPDTRKFALSSGDGVPDSDSTALARGLEQYYAALRVETAGKPSSWPYRKFLQHEQVLRSFGSQLVNRLQAVAPERPLRLLDLISGTDPLYRPGFGLQCASLYDSFLASDIFQMRVAYMDYGGWDSHKSQRTQVEPQWQDLFGAGRGLDVLSSELELLPGVSDNLVFMFTTDFGRQIAANGSFGCDHGRGNYLVLVGRPVNGGVYGEMFPASEIPRFGQTGADIEGLTDFRLLLAALCDWAEPGSGAQVFPEVLAGGLDQEIGVQPGQLLA